MSMSVSRALRGVALPVAVVWGFAASAQDALTVVDGYLAAWNAHDSAAAAEFFADGVVYYDASVGTPVETATIPMARPALIRSASATGTRYVSFILSFPSQVIDAVTISAAANAYRNVVLYGVKIGRMSKAGMMLVGDG